MIGIAIYKHVFLKMRLFMHILASSGHPQDNNLFISEGIQTFTLLVIFLLYYDKVFTKMNNILYTGIVNILS